MPSRRAALPFQQLGVIVVGMSVAVWWPAFTLGAWGEIFFDTLLSVWAAASAGFVLAMLVPAARRRLGWTSLTLLLPSLWLVLSLAVPNESENLGVAIVAVVGVLVVLLGVPFMVWALARLAWPEISETVPQRGKMLVLATVAVVAIASFALGANESRFLTCEDFTISGNSEPPGCVHESP
ncbi:hypothetical protein B7R21_02210 [Subtercola boreus]|uniref:Uncharacterized protein n=1 Tax=Subtercola boreus TaxID=120213 RepID=A0A3E0W249_9MICO|nr:hypothetical protein B7R21_02210 [Subtercola boreus]